MAKKAKGFYTKTENGNTLHAHGDLNMSDDTLQALGQAADLAVEQFDGSGVRVGYIYREVCGREREVGRELVITDIVDGIAYYQLHKAAGGREPGKYVFGRMTVEKLSSKNQRRHCLFRLVRDAAREYNLVTVRSQREAGIGPVIVY